MSYNTLFLKLEQKMRKNENINVPAQLFFLQINTLAASKLYLCYVGNYALCSNYFLRKICGDCDQRRGSVCGGRREIKNNTRSVKKSKDSEVATFTISGTCFYIFFNTVQHWYGKLAGKSHCCLTALNHKSFGHDCVVKVVQSLNLLQFSVTPTDPKLEEHE